MPLKADIWHYHRKKDAQRYIEILNSGINNSLTLFAPRRKGKTALILHDIRPLAIAANYNVIYCTFWDNKDRPALALFTSIQLATKLQTVGERFKDLLKSPVSKLGLKMADCELSVELDGSRDTEQDILHKLSIAFNDVAKSARRTLFLFDEVQHLATDKSFEPLVATIRSAFDKNSDKLCAIYTGSSRDNLHRLFHNTKSPLFNASQEYPLPDMGPEFIEFILGKFKQASGQDIRIADAISVWKNMLSPYHFMGVIEYMLVNVQSDIISSTKKYQQEQIELNNFPTIVESLGFLDKLLLLRVKDGQCDFYAKKTLCELADKVGIEKLTKTNVQNAVERLKNKGLISKVGQGSYVIEDLSFIVYLNENF